MRFYDNFRKAKGSIHDFGEQKNLFSFELTKFEKKKIFAQRFNKLLYCIDHVGNMYNIFYLIYFIERGM